MKVINTKLSGCLILEPEVHEDSRGFFMESFNSTTFLKATGIEVNFVQDNHSQSTKGVLRGLHYQKLNPQGKLVRVSRGSVFDVAVDIRSNSQTYGSWVGIELSEFNKLQLWIPEGFAHGFISLTDDSEILYMVSSAYAGESEGTLPWNDPFHEIEWPIAPSILSDKDQKAKKWDDSYSIIL